MSHVINLLLAAAFVLGAACSGREAGPVETAAAEPEKKAVPEKPAPPQTPDDFRAELESRGIAFTREEFARQIADGNLENVEYFLAAGMDARWTDDAGGSPLILAVKKGNPAIVRLLVAAGADAAAKQGSGKTLLEAALQNGKGEIALLLIEKGAAVNPDEACIVDNEGLLSSSCGMTPLALAASSGDSASVKALVEKGANVNIRDSESGRTALELAIHNKHYAAAKVMIEKGFDINSLETAALLSLVAEEKIELLQMILAAGYSPDVRYHLDGRTMLIEACVLEKAQVVKLLLDHGADKTLEDDQDLTAMKAAKKAGNKQIIELISAAPKPGAEESPDPD
ncbi:MAG: ankyrin repeat domain-containing protein [Pseudomonadota bacterium]